MSKLIKAEQYRLIHTPKLIVLMIAVTITSMICTLRPVASQALTHQEVLMLMGDERYLGFFGAIMAAYYFSIDYQTRSLNGALYKGFSRSTIYLVKTTSYLCVSMLMSLLSLLLIQLMKGPEAFYHNGCGVISIIITRMLFDLRIWAIPLLIVHCTKKMIPAVSIGTAFGFLCLVSNNTNVYTWLIVLNKGPFIIKSISVFGGAMLIGFILFDRAELR